MPGPSSRSPAADFLQRKRKRERAAPAPEVDRARESERAPDDGAQQAGARLQKDYSENLSQLRAWICDEKPVSDSRAEGTRWRSRLRRLLRSIG